MKAHPAPSVPYYAYPYLLALRTLKGDRVNTQNGYVCPIPFTAIERYADRFVPEGDFEFFLDTLMSIDEEFVLKQNLKIKRLAENGRN